MLQMKTMRWEPQWSHRFEWQPNDNWRNFHLNSVFIARYDHQNSSHRSVGGGGGGWFSPHLSQGNRWSSWDYGWPSWKFRSQLDPYTLIKSKHGFQFFGTGDDENSRISHVPGETLVLLKRVACSIEGDFRGIQKIILWQGNNGGFLDILRRISIWW